MTLFSILQFVISIIILQEIIKINQSISYFTNLEYNNRICTREKTIYIYIYVYVWIYIYIFFIYNYNNNFIYNYI